jgi:HSP20 family protein
MTLVKWNPTRSLTTDFDRMMDGIFNDGWNTTPTVRTNSLPVDIMENEKAFILNADFPGFDKKEVNLKVEDGVLTLSANRDSDSESNESSFRIRERRSDSFSRSFSLPENVLADNIVAKFKNGTLTVSIPKAEEVKPDIRQIKIG